ncbi:polysaccharide deacetylase family protein [Paenibacillus paridis]|uniref:polysaccharide deacetylase family protein n=1 Tax=Paenibacillus paridis TaxID=2583376 RepID=UPI00111EE33F|nr:polysaccharide deacetylase family protein [Paenibacillus paridis]
MKSARKQNRKMFLLLIMIVVAIGISGCSTGSSLSLSSIFSGEKQTVDHTGSTGKGPQTGSATDQDEDVVVIGNGGNDDGGIVHGHIGGQPTTDKPDASATDKPDASATDKPDAPATDKPDAPATDKPDASATDKPDAPATDKPSTTPTGKPDASATDKPSTSPTGKPDAPATDKPVASGTDKLDKPDEQAVVEKPSKDAKLIAITFDDGPDKNYTTDILDILKEKDVKATFFVVGQQVTKNPKVLERIVDEGHAIGNHTYNHKDLSKLNKQQIIEEVKTADAAIKKAVGFTPVMFRAPYGAVSDTLKDLLKAGNRDMIGWNIDTRDWAGTSVAGIRKMIKKEAKPGGIILMHSFGGKHIKNTVQALPGVIDDLKDMGYTFVFANQIS